MPYLRPRCLTSGALALVLPVIAPAALGAQQARATLEQFLRADVALPSPEIASALRGTVVVKVLDTSSPRDIAVFGIVAVNAPRARIVQRLSAFPGSLATPTRTRLGLFGDPPSLRDVAEVRVDDEAMGELRKCRPSSCNFKMPAADMSRVQQLLAGGATRETVAGYVRQRMVEYVADYRARGNAALVVYDDRGAVRASDAFGDLLAASPYLYRYVPRLHQYLRAYPAARPDGARDALVWWQDEMPGLRPILGITHVTLYDTPELPGMSIVSAKQLYANHYFEAAFDLLTVVDRADAPGSAYLVVLRRYRFDNLPSGGLLNIRGRVVGKLRDAMRTELARAKREYESTSSGSSTSGAQ
jgi:hypothetical protein